VLLLPSYIYTYDNNGNELTQTNTVNNKSITYNMLNLPQVYTLSGGTVTYTYDADGTKLRKVSSTQGTTDYISGIQYKANSTVIDFIQTEEGRVLNPTTAPDYEYTLTDHLGNNRVTFDMVNGKVGEDDYYPFGLNVHRELNAGNNYLYNKKELQVELNEYDYGARFYDPVIGRFTTIDFLSEKYDLQSPYSYGGDDPIRFVDINGDGPGDRVKAALRLTKGTPYKQEQGSLRTITTPVGLKYMDCSELVCRVLAADGITHGVKSMATSELRTYLSSKQFIHSTDAKIGDIALWSGHTGIVGAVNNKNQIKLIHERGHDKPAGENKSYLDPDSYASGETFLGYYRPVVETPDGKLDNNGNEKAGGEDEEESSKASTPNTKHTKASGPEKLAQEINETQDKINAILDKMEKDLH
jgi:RHS repeat-associated protein